MPFPRQDSRGCQNKSKYMCRRLEVFLNRENNQRGQKFYASVRFASHMRNCFLSLFVVRITRQQLCQITSSGPRQRLSRILMQFAVR